MSEPEGSRHSEAASAFLISDPDERARREAENGLRQFDSVVGLVQRYLAEHWRFALRVSTILGLHRDALLGVHALAGNFRPSTVEIKGSKHVPPDAWQVPQLVEEMCDYVNDHWETATPLHLAAYVMWRLNWIHPFADGNGRTARAVSYLVLCMKMNGRIPGTRTIPDQIAANKKPYYDALERADERWASLQVIDLSSLKRCSETCWQTNLSRRLKRPAADQSANRFTSGPAARPGAGAARSA